MEPADVLEQAADLLESGQVPWNQYGQASQEDQAWRQKDDGACALEALSRAAGGPYKVYYSARLHLAEHLAQTQDWTAGIGRWNDTKGRTLGEVVDAMKETAKGLRNAAS